MCSRITSTVFATPLAAAVSKPAMSSSSSRIPPSALPVTPASAARSERVAEREVPRLARTQPTRFTDVSPTPRFGVLTTRRQLTSSSGFTSARR